MEFMLICGNTKVAGLLSKKGHNMPKYQWEKLVRDKIVNKVKDEGHTIEYKQLSDKELSSALYDKISEELEEVKVAKDKQELTEELADLQQIINDICKINQISQDNLEEIRLKKESKKGGFTQGFYVKSVNISDISDPWVEYFESQPDKYPKIK